MDEPKKYKSKKYKRKVNYRIFCVWHFVCAGIGLALWLVNLFMWMGYITAEHKFCAEATIVKIDTKAEQRLKNKDDVNYSPTDRYETYYTYRLTWRFMNPDSEKKYSFVRETEAQFDNAHEYGEKMTVYVYYNDDESDYEIVEPFYTVLFVLGGAAFIVVAVVDVIRRLIRKKKMMKQPVPSPKSYVPGRETAPDVR